MKENSEFLICSLKDQKGAIIHYKGIYDGNRNAIIYGGGICFITDVDSFIPKLADFTNINSLRPVFFKKFIFSFLSDHLLITIGY